jgi:hypothetical protein
VKSGRIAAVGSARKELPAFRYIEERIADLQEKKWCCQINIFIKREFTEDYSLNNHRLNALVTIANRYNSLSISRGVYRNDQKVYFLLVSIAHISSFGTKYKCC